MVKSNVAHFNYGLSSIAVSNIVEGVYNEEYFLGSFSYLSFSLWYNLSKIRKEILSSGDTFNLP